MKTILSFLTGIGLVLALGTASTAVDIDSLINALDPSKVPGYVDMETGAATLAPTNAQFVERGSAAGGIGKEHDTFLNYIDPSRVPGFVELETGAVTRATSEFMIRGSAAGGIGKDHGSLLNDIAGDPDKIVY